jgi:hypothetical protein
MGHCECFPIQSPFAPVLRNVLFSFGGKEIHCELFGPLDLCADLLDALVCAYVVVVTRLFLLLFLMSHHRCAQVDLVAIRLHFNLVRCSQTKKQITQASNQEFLWHHIAALISRWLPTFIAMRSTISPFLG